MQNRDSLTSGPEARDPETLRPKMARPGILRLEILGFKRKFVPRKAALSNKYASHINSPLNHLTLNH